MKLQIKHRWSGAVLFEAEAETTKTLVEQAVKTRANLSGAYLSGANLYRANLSRADLSGADLSGASLYRANLYGASLYGADLPRADLSGANLYRADLSRANLSGANLSGANLYRADLYRANLSRADLSGADLSGASLYRADLSRAKYNDERTIKAVLQLGPLGSRSAYSVVYLLDDASLRWHTGCFAGSLDEFQDAVAKTHGDSKHGREYQAAIQFVLAWASLQSEA